MREIERDIAGDDLSWVVRGRPGRMLVVRTLWGDGCSHWIQMVTCTPKWRHVSHASGD